MNKFKTLIKKLKESLYRALKRYPIALVLFMLCAVMFMFVVEIDFRDSILDEGIFVRLALSCLLGGVLALVVQSIIERFEIKSKLIYIVWLIIPIVMVLNYFIIIVEYTHSISMLRYALLTISSAALFFYIPFINKDKSAPFFAQKVFLRLAITFIYYGIITGGVTAIIFALENLLAINMPEQIYAHTAIAIAGIILPAFFVAGIPNKDDTQDAYPKLLKILLLYIVFTLLCAYTLVLYAYFIKILFEFQLPSNLLGNLVIYYSMISVAALYFAKPINSESKWSTFIYKVYPYTVILPVVMMFVSFMVRINAYGITESRYYAILCVIYVLVSIAIIKIKKLNIRLMPLLLSVLLLISVFGPLSSFSISKASQNSRLKHILAQSDMLDYDEIIPDESASDETKHEITEILKYFDNTHDLFDIKLLPEGYTDDDMEEVFGFKPFYLKKSLDTNEFRRLLIDYTQFEIIEVSGYDYIAQIFSGMNDIDIKTDQGTLLVNVNSGKQEEIILTLNDKSVYKTNLLELIEPHLSTSSNIEEPQELTFLDENDQVSIKILVEYASYFEEEHLFDYSIRLLIRLNK
ncbi:MAG: DUF4153 domain-containing protein [Clostridiales bacterium]|nr:DUF4153 domain-containing protein [Clostridiales bacterium]